MHKCQARVSLENTLFVDNYAYGDSGGAIASGINGFDSEFSMHGLLFSGNVAADDGANVYFIADNLKESSPLELTMSTVDDRLPDGSPIDGSSIYVSNLQDWKLNQVVFHPFDGSSTVYDVGSTGDGGCTGYDAQPPSEDFPAPCENGKECRTLNSSAWCFQCETGAYNMRRARVAHLPSY